MSDSIAVGVEVDSGSAGNDRGGITCSVVANVCHGELPSEVTVAATPHQSHVWPSAVDAGCLVEG